MGNIINGKEIAANTRLRIKEEAGELIKKTGVTPGLAVILVGDDAASKVYVKNKTKDCAEIGFKSFEHILPEDTTQDELMALVKKLNSDSAIHGILCQLPLPCHLDERAVINAIDPKKDVDAFNPSNVGKIMIGSYDFLPCTPAGVMELIHSTGVSVSGKNCVVVGRSNIVGKPMSMLLLHENGTVTTCHSRTANLKAETLRADILVAAAGRAKLIKADMVKDGAVVIDVGMNRDESGKLCGDVDFEAVKDKASYITPVPGGVGPMTRAMLMRNTLTAYKLALGIE